MASKLNKSDYEKALSAEYGFPVFLNDKEYERLAVSKPNPERPAKAYEDPFAYLDDEKARKSKPDAWTTKAGTSYNKDHGRASKPLAGVPAPTGSAKPVAASSKIERIDSPAASPPAYAALGTPLTADSSFVAGQGVAPGWVTPKQDTFGPKDFGIPMTGDPLSSKAPAAGFDPYSPGAVGAIQAALPATPEGPRWMSEEDEWNRDLAKYAALSTGGK